MIQSAAEMTVSSERLFPTRGHSLHKIARLQARLLLGIPVRLLRKLRSSQQLIEPRPHEFLGSYLVLNATGCSDDLACLRALPFDTFYAAANGTYNPAVVIDGDFIQASFWSLYTERKFVNTPLMLGNNLDEATSGIGAPVGVNNDSVFEAAIRSNIANLNLSDRNTTVQQILNIFPDDPSQGCPFNTGPGLIPTGLQDKRVNWFYTDSLAAGMWFVA